MTVFLIYNAEQMLNLVQTHVGTAQQCAQKHYNLKLCVCVGLCYSYFNALTGLFFYIFLIALCTITLNTNLVVIVLLNMDSGVIKYKAAVSSGGHWMAS